jgi:hypothetical protein
LREPRLIGLPAIRLPSIAPLIGSNGTMRKKLFRCDECDPAVIFHGRTPYDYHMRTHKRLALPASRQVAPKRPPVWYDDSGAESVTDEGEQPNA